MPYAYLSDKSKALLDELRAIADRAKSTGRELTDAERARCSDLVERATKSREDDQRAEAKRADADLADQIKAFGADIGLGGDTGRDDSRKSGRYGPYIGREPSNWVKSTRAAIEKTRGQFGVKALATGSITTDAPLADPAGDYTSMGQTPTRLVDLLTDRVRVRDTNTYTYLQQTVRENNAAPVPDAEEKPTSIYRYEEREGRTVVIAHLSEATPERFFDDTAELERFLQSEMEYGLLTAIEAQMMTGSGVGENLRGVLNTSGTFARPWAGSLPATLRKARTQLEVAGELPTAWAVHPADDEALDLLREGADGMFLNGNFADNILGQLPVVPTVAVPPGKAILANWPMLQLVVRQEAKIDADRSGELFRTNQVQMRVEGRYGFAVRRPSAVCIVTTTST